MSFPLQIALVFLIGLGAGLLYFTGLMITILKVRGMSRPGLLLMASFIVRIVFIGGVFYAVGNGQWQRFAACLIGFLFARQVTVMLWRPSRNDPRKEIEVKPWRS